jgi:hypothetical protein
LYRQPTLLLLVMAWKIFPTLVRSLIKEGRPGGKPCPPLQSLLQAVDLVVVAGLRRWHSALQHLPGPVADFIKPKGDE